MSIVSIVRDGIRDLKPYEAAVQVKDTIRLNANEAPWTSSGDRYRRPLNRYPEIRPAGLSAALARRYGCAADNLLVTRGTSEAIDLLLRVFCSAGKDSVATTTPSFSMYQHYARVQGAQLREVETRADNDFRLDPDALLAACDASTKLVFLCSPNNPTGTSLDRDALVQILDARRDKSAIVVDEAYIEFSDDPSAVALLREFDNVVVLRTLSKALAYAGARCGSVIANGDIIRLLDAVQAPYALATPVVECVEDALQAQCLDEAERWIAHVVAERERLIADIAPLPFVRRVFPSTANFFLVQVDDAAKLMRHTAEDRVLLRYFGGPLADCVRITVGSSEENDALLATMTRMRD